MGFTCLRETVFCVVLVLSLDGGTGDGEEVGRMEHLLLSRSFVIWSLAESH